MNQPSFPADLPLPPGACIEGRYLLGETIGRGGAGTVVAAHHITLDAPVAIKFLRPSEMTHDARKRFMREARLTHALKSEHVVRVHDVGELSTPGRELYLVMERLVGRTLGDELRARGPLPEHEAADLIAQACEAVGEAHALGIVHRDLKPQNLFLHESPVGRMVKVLDFGLSKEVEGVAPAHTRTFMFMGTPRYMPPEQWEPGAVADPRMDVFALGVVLHELLTGQVPFEHVPLKQRAPLILGASIPDPRAVRPTISDRMAEIVIECLKPRAEDRMPSARHLERLLRALGTSTASSGAATLMLSRIVPAKTNPGIVRSDTPPEAIAVPVAPRVPSPSPPPSPSQSFSASAAAEGRASDPPKAVAGSLARPSASEVTANANANATSTDAIEEEDDDDDFAQRRTVLALVLLLMLLAIGSTLALLEATGHLRH